jgi:hypothetical protein
MRRGLSLTFCGLAGLAACLALPGCAPGPLDGAAPAASASNVSLDLRIFPDPPVAGPVRVSLVLADGATGRPVQGAAVRLEGNMSHAGMRPVFAAAREVAPGTYEAPLELTMGGDWFLLVDATLPDGGTLHRQLDLPGVRPR